MTDTYGHTAARSAFADLPRPVWAGLLLLVPLLGGLAALALGKDFNWDFRNYHFYNAYALLHDRLGFDIAPAQRQTYHNPLIDLPLYGMIQILPSRWIGFLLGAAQGLNFTLVFVLYWAMCRLERPAAKTLIGLAVAAMGCIAPAFVLELGTCLGDNVISLFVIAALIAAVLALASFQENRRRASLLRILVAGLLMGAAVGLKLTTGVFALASAVALLAVVATRRAGWSMLLCYGLAGVSGALLTGGYWAWTLWQEFGNPLFPYFNHVFRSPAVAPAAFVDARFLTHEYWEYFVWPLVFSADFARVGHGGVEDVRFAVLYAAYVVLAVATAWRMRDARMRVRGPGGTFDRLSGSFLLLFVLCAFVLWMLLYSIYRYIVPLELLAPLCFVVILDRLGLSARSVAALCVAAATAVFAMFGPHLLVRAAWTRSYLTIDLSPYEMTDGTIVVLLGWEPMGFVVPGFPPHVRFVRPDGNLLLTREHGLYRESVRLIAEGNGPRYLMHGADDDPEGLAVKAEALGLVYDPALCDPLRTEPAGRVVLCRAR